MNLADKIAAAGIVGALLDGTNEAVAEACIARYGREQGATLAGDAEFARLLSERFILNRAGWWRAIDADPDDNDFDDFEYDE